VVEWAVLVLLAATEPAPVSLPPPIPAETEEAKEEETHLYGLHTTSVVPLSAGGVEATLERNPRAPFNGYYPLRVYLHHKDGPAVEAEVSLDSHGSSSVIRQSVKLAPGERKLLTLPVPSNFGSGSIHLQAGSRSAREPFYLSTLTGPSEAVMVLGSAVQLEERIHLRPGDPNRATATLVPLDEAPDTLASYVGYAAVVIPSAGLEDLSEGGRRALEAYAATGGALAVGKPSRATRQLLPALPAAADPGQERHPYLFGSVVLCPEDCSPALQRLVGAGGPGLTPRAAQFSERGRSRRMRRYYASSEPAVTPLLPQADPPVGRFLLIIGVFTLAIGPGSALIARRRGPLALVVTLPITAAVTCLCLVTYSLVRDGFSIKAATRGYTLFDPEAARAVTLEVAGFYANLPPAGAEFPLLTAVIPAHGQGTGELDWSRGTRFGSGFLPPRSYREWGLAAVEPSRARVLVRPADGGGWKVSNGMGVLISTAKLKLEGRFYRVETLRPGEEARAVEVSDPGNLLPVFELTDVPPRLEESAAARLAEPLQDGEIFIHSFGPGPLSLGGFPVDHEGSEHWYRGKVSR
jgi:hypothetical protein